MSLTRDIDYTHAAAPDLVQDFVIAQAPLLIWHVHFGDQPFKIWSRDLISGFESLTQKTTHTNSSVESFSGATLVAGCRFRLCRRHGDAIHSGLSVEGLKR